jgi:hypothetical protein
MVRVEEMESAATATGAEIAEELREMVAEVPLWVAVSVADPPPKTPQLAVMVAVCGVTAAAEGAKARPVTARAPAASAAPIAVRLPLMEIRFPSLVGSAKWGDRRTRGLSRRMRTRCTAVRI